MNKKPLEIYIVNYLVKHLEDEFLTYHYNNNEEEDILDVFGLIEDIIIRVDDEVLFDIEEQDFINELCKLEEQWRAIQ